MKHTAKMVELSRQWSITQYTMYIDNYMYASYAGEKMPSTLLLTQFYGTVL